MADKIEEGTTVPTVAAVEATPKLPGSSTPAPAAKEAKEAVKDDVVATEAEEVTAEQELEKSFESMADDMLSNEEEGDTETPLAEEQVASEELEGKVGEEPETPVATEEELAAEAKEGEEPKPQEAEEKPIEPAPVEAKPKVEETAKQEFTQEQIDTDRAKMVDTWTERYAMSEDEGIEMLAAPHEALPKFAARLHTQVTEDVLRTMATVLPQMMQQVSDADRVKDAFNEAFYKAWPKLNDDKYRPTIHRITDLYVRENSGAKSEQIIQEVGASAMIAFKIVPDDLVPAQPGLDVASPVEIPFTPAQPGGGSAPVVEKPITNQFEALSVEFEKDDAG